MMTYTSPGARTDLDITATVDVSVKKSENETKRTQNALSWNGNQFARIDLAGSITLASYSKQPLEVEVVRHVIGDIDDAGSGKKDMFNLIENPDMPDGYPSWWYWYGWPYWWNHVNGMGRITWTVKLDPGKPVTLDYSWHYFWR